MCKTRFPSSGEGPVFPAPEPLDTSPCRQTHLDADPPPDAGHVTCAACWEATPVNRMTHRCKNITLSQTSSADGNQAEAEQ